MKSRDKVGMYRPMGEVKTVYFRKGGKLVRVGRLCLTCLLFIPDPDFVRPSFSFRTNPKSSVKVNDGKKVKGGSK